MPRTSLSVLRRRAPRMGPLLFTGQHPKRSRRVVHLREWTKEATVNWKDAGSTDEDVTRRAPSSMGSTPAQTGCLDHRFAAGIVAA